MKFELYFNPTWAKTRQGINIPLWASHSPENLLLQKEDKPLLFIGGVHGDEPEGVWLAEAFLHEIQTHLRRQQPRPQGHHPFAFKKPWILIPCLNQEGYLAQTRTNSAGVDLNRNFPSADWSSEAKAERYFPGPHPNSEPETKALVQLIEKNQPSLIIHFHSWNPCIVYTGAPGRSVAESLAQHSGYPFNEDIGYPTPGSLGQFGWLTHQTPVICIEEQDKNTRQYIWRRFRWALMDLIL